MKKLKYVLLIVLIFNLTLFSQNGSTVPKQGGICFRVDDNGLISQFRDYTNVFEKYNKKYTFALNLGFNEFDSQDYIDSIKVFQNLGNELMDHTPNHRTNYFTTKFDTNYYKAHIGVDHIEGNKICLKHEAANLSAATRSDTATISNDTIYFSNSNYSAIKKYDERYIYLAAPIDTLVIVKKYKNHKAIITDIWDNPISISKQIGVTYYTFIFRNINLTSDAIYLLADETIKLAKRYKIIPPKTWIQPGGVFLEFNSDEIKTPMESLGYKQAATYPNEAKKVYNEYNPTGERQFAMQWGDFIETDDSLTLLKTKIADGIAKHKMLIGNAHWYSEGSTEWTDYLIKNDSLLSWATRNSIPTKTYSEWTDLLYFQTPDPYENIMPPLNVDKDENGIPDGYTNVLYPNNIIGTLVIDSTTPGPGENYYYATTDNAYDPITNILELGGFEKGANDFSIWTKGSPGDSVEVVFSEPVTGNNKVRFKFPAVTSTWEKHSLSEQGKSFIVNDTTSILDVDIYCSDYVSDTVKIAGMSLSKMVEITELEMNVISVLPAPAGDSVFVEVIAKDEFGNPHDNYFSYSLDTTGSSTVEIIPSLVRAFNGSDRDTIIVRDTTAGTFSLIAKLTNDTLITATTDIIIEPGDVKYLNILSSQDSIAVGDSLLLQIALEDTFKNRIPDSLVTFEALNGDGKFSNGLQNISVPTDTIGVAQDLYSVSTSLSYQADTIKVHFKNTLLDTIILPLKAGLISKFELVTLNTLPAIVGDSVLIEITAKDIFGNQVVSSLQYEMSADSSTTAGFLPSNLYSFNNSSKDTVIVIDTVAGSFYAIAKLLSDTLVVDSALIDIVYSPKPLRVKIMLEGPYSSSNTMTTDINSIIPLQQPYNVSPWNYNGGESVLSVPSGVVDWVLITLRKDIDSNNPDPTTAYDVATKAAFLRTKGFIVALNGFDPLNFEVKQGKYYIVVEHRNHLSVMSSVTVELTE